MSKVNEINTTLNKNVYVHTGLPALLFMGLPLSATELSHDIIMMSGAKCDNNNIVIGDMVATSIHHWNLL